MFAGTFTVPISNLRDPPSSLKVRDVKGWYVDYLVGLLSTNDQEDLTLPLLVLASVGKTDFRPERLATYTYQVLCSAFILIYRKICVLKFQYCYQGYVCLLPYCTTSNAVSHSHVELLCARL